MVNMKEIRDNRGRKVNIQLRVFEGIMIFVAGICGMGGFMSAGDGKLYCILIALAAAVLCGIVWLLEEALYYYNR